MSYARCRWRVHELGDAGGIITIQPGCMVISAGAFGENPRGREESAGWKMERAVTSLQGGCGHGFARLEALNPR